MKAIKSFILLILLASSSLTFSQGNIFPEGRKWIIREYKINPTVNYNNIITCLVSGDTILAGHSYKKVHFTNHATNDTDVSMLIRRDGSKIYQRYGSYGKWNPDTLVFDENWQKGDKTTLPFGHNADGTISSYAEIFETGQIEGRKYWNINDSYTWVQDVGYITTRLFFDAYGINYGGSLYDVICCVEANGDTLYVNRDILHSSFSQVGNMLEDGRQWVTGVFEVLDIENDSQVEYLKYIIAEEGYGYCLNITINGDTTIEGNVYKKMYSRHFWSQENITTDDQLEALIRYKEGKYLYRFLSEKNIEEYKQKYPQSFYGDDFLLFDENLVVGDTTDKKEIITEVVDTLYPQYSDKVLKYWKIKDDPKLYRNYFRYFNDIKWVSGVGFPTTLRMHPEYEVDCLCEDVLLYCVAANGDTLYRNNYYWYPHLTNIPTIPEFEISTKVLNGGVVVYIDATVEWTATLYNSNGVTVAQQQGNGNEAFLSTDSKGTHILVVKAGGRVVKKKIMLR